MTTPTDARDIAVLVSADNLTDFIEMYDKLHPWITKATLAKRVVSLWQQKNLYERKRMVIGKQMCNRYVPMGRWRA